MFQVILVIQWELDHLLELCNYRIKHGVEEPLGLRNGKSKDCEKSNPLFQRQNIAGELRGLASLESLVYTIHTPARTYFISGLKSRVLKSTFLK